ncbi:MAG: Uma2 family endonuclease, partial [Bryobacteraceae bacterium]
EDSLTMPEDRFEEIVHGESRRISPPTDRHGALLLRLLRTLMVQLDSAQHQVLPSGFGLGIERAPAFTCRIPDLMVYAHETLRRDRHEKAVDDPYLWEAPELLVECLSPSNRKGSTWELLADYERAGVAEVWLIDPRDRCVTAYVLQDARLIEAWRVSGGVVSPVGLPEARIEIEMLWDAFDHGLAG